MTTPNPRPLRIGPPTHEWPHAPPRGDCPQCGGQCDGDDCGRHAAGCLFGGPTEGTAYWLIADGCPHYHGEPAAPPHREERDPP